MYQPEQKNAKPDRRMFDPDNIIFERNGNGHGNGHTEAVVDVGANTAVDGALEVALETAAFGSCPLPIANHDTVQLGHGSGGQMTSELVSGLFLWAFDNPYLRALDDGALFDISGRRMVMSTDSFVVDPIIFPGGDIGELAVNGTVNDVAMMGAEPLFMSVGMILEEGLPIAELKTIVESMARAARAAGVTIVTGDTKVVNRGKGDKVFVNTTAVGAMRPDVSLSASLIQPGDIVIVSGTIADHGMAILSKREGIAFDSPIRSDTAALNGIASEVMQAAGSGLRAMRDPTRGGLAATLNEFAEAAGVGIELQEGAVPVRPAVRGACEFLGLDPLYVANEGKFVMVVAPDVARRVMDVLKANRLGVDAAIIGRVHDRSRGMVSMRTAIGGERIVDMLVGEQLPRIC